jgi:hypothetical protein
MIIKRNVSAPAQFVGQAAGPTIRYNQGTLQAQQGMFEAEMGLTKTLVNTGTAVGAGLAAGFAGATTQDLGQMSVTGGDAPNVDKAGFDVGKFSEQFVDTLGGKDAIMKGSAEHGNVFANAVNSYQKGVQIGETYANQQFQGFQIRAKDAANVEFQKAVKDGDYSNASTRAVKVYEQEMIKFRDADTTTSYVQNKISSGLQTGLVQAELNSSYMPKATNAVANKNATNAKIVIDRAKDNLIDMAMPDVAEASYMKVIDTQIESGAINMTSEEREAMRADFQSSRVQYKLSDPDASVEELEVMSSDLKSGSEHYKSMTKKAKQAYREKIESRITELQTRNYKELGETVVNAVEGTDGYSIDNTAAQLKEKMDDGEITGMQYKSLKSKLYPSDAKKIYTKENIAKSNDKLKGYASTAMRIALENDILSNPSAQADLMNLKQQAMSEEGDAFVPVFDKVMERIDKAMYLASDAADASDKAVLKSFSNYYAELQKDADDDELVQLELSSSAAFRAYEEGLLALGDDANNPAKKRELSEKIVNDWKKEGINYRYKKSMKLAQQQGFGMASTKQQKGITDAQVKAEQDIEAGLKAEADAAAAEQEADKTEVFSTHTAKALGSYFAKPFIPKDGSKTKGKKVDDVIIDFLEPVIDVVGEAGAEMSADIGRFLDGIKTKASNAAELWSTIGESDKEKIKAGMVLMSPATWGITSSKKAGEYIEEFLTDIKKEYEEDK